MTVRAPAKRTAEAARPSVAELYAREGSEPKPVRKSRGALDTLRKLPYLKQASWGLAGSVLLGVLAGFVIADLRESPPSNSPSLPADHQATQLSVPGTTAPLTSDPLTPTTAPTTASDPASNTAPHQPSHTKPHPTKKSPPRTTKPGSVFVTIGAPCNSPGSYAVTSGYRPVVCSPSGHWQPIY